MKAKDVLRAVSDSMLDPKESGYIDEFSCECGTVEKQLESYFGEVDFDESVYDQVKFGGSYYYSCNACLSIYDDVEGEFENCPVNAILYLKDGKEVYIYNVED